jgi:hypothetical protein
MLKMRSSVSTRITWRSEAHVPSWERVAGRVLQHSTFV